MPVSFFPTPAPGRGRRFLGPPAALFALGLLLAACGGGGSFSAPSDSGGSSGGGGSGAVVAPTLTAVVPDSGPSGGGTLVTLIGTDFSSGANVHFGMNKNTPFSVTSTAIQVFTPPHDSGTVDVWVVNPGPSPGALFNSFTYDPPAGQSLLFTNVTRAAGITFKHTRDTVELPVSAGLAIADFNNDGWDDFYLTNTGGANALYINQQDGTFVDQAVLAGVDLPASIDNAACAADFDNNGDPDLYV
ncbi:IPT/TIG domain-containing protein, partial [Acidobacteriia bacterium AH_259_A11_L15]|nr:IPT/TIG domain-containing protein [Acidobacteriia bacterium AH_259_A11_L15]